MSETPTEQRRVEHDAGAPAARPISRVRLWGVTAAVVGGSLALNAVSLLRPVSYPETFFQFLLAWALFGAQAAPLALVAAWAVFGSWNVVVRLPAALLLGMAMWGAMVLDGWPFALDTSTGVNLLADLFVAQVPLWIAKKGFRWRLAGGAAGTAKSRYEGRQFQLKHFMLATFSWPSRYPRFGPSTRWVRPGRSLGPAASLPRLWLQSSWIAL